MIGTGNVFLHEKLNHLDNLIGIVKDGLDHLLPTGRECSSALFGSIGTDSGHKGFFRVNDFLWHIFNVDSLACIKSCESHISGDIGTEEKKVAAVELTVGQSEKSGIGCGSRNVRQYLGCYSCVVLKGPFQFYFYFASFG